MTRPYIFIYIARPESILARNGRAVIYISPGMLEALQLKSWNPDEIHQMAKEHAQQQVLNAREISKLNRQVKEVQAEKEQTERERQEGARLLEAERRRCRALEEQLAQYLNNGLA
ncbi:hypothetical protein JAAARDRAFT_36301 [Jaapia argillacea MUCL 33604]|uniref:Uncharacterized protein n=1 Tax=Jaapia argillacea MUCL 33604 TaxID=933084 RepID=A0A067PSM0_9AGAM|nr:hypothetical protein JAAARDRAFT_43169 [Jaapia argillacea MUCL 33604]KDQ56825.1 hypothetical protein JAAARDRAFT_36301 [Jaapia argillacea MUCL 33604]